MPYGRVVDQLVVEILTNIPGFSIEQCFHPDFLATCVFDEDLELGWVVDDNGVPHPHPPMSPTPEPTPEPDPAV